ncbi:hypothetical protein P4S72_15320 [Vibrio sp. PP-XX7]
MAFFMLAGLGDGIAEACFFITRAQLTPTQIRLPIFSLMSRFANLGFGVGMVVFVLSSLDFSQRKVAIPFSYDPNDDRRGKSFR